MEQPSRLLNKNFFLLWQGQFVSQLGSQVHSIAMMFWIKHATGSATLMGTIMMLSMLPGIILGPIGGTIADNFSRKKIIVVSDILCGILVLALAGIIYYFPDDVSVAVVWIFVIGIGMGIISAFFRPAILAAIPDLVPREKIPAANSMNQSSFQISSLLGQGTGGVLFRVLGAPLLFLIDGITYLFSAVSEMFITIPQIIPEKTAGFKPIMKKFLTDTGIGFKFVWSNKGMRAVFFTTTLFNFLLSPVVVLMPFYIEDHLHLTPDWFGYLIAADGVGALIGYTIAGAVKVSGKVRSAVLITFLSLVGVDFALMGWSSSGPLSISLLLLFGILTGAININIATVLQLTTPSEIRGRVFGLLGTIIGGLVPVGMGLAGVVADMLDNNIPLIFIICGLTMAAINLLMAFNRHFREFMACEVKAEEKESAIEENKELNS